MPETLAEQLKDRADVEENVPLATMTTLKIGGPARYVIYPYSTMTLESVLRILRKNHIPYRVIGKGSNLLCSDAGYDGAVLRLDRYFNKFYFEGSVLTAEAGCSIISLAYDAMKNSLSGLEFASGIPATVGGVVCMNAGAYKACMADILRRVQVMHDGQLEWLPCSACHFAYRHSLFQEHPDWVVTAAEFNLRPGDRGEIRALMDDRRQRRMASQPLDKPSAGSVFRNPDCISAWKLIEGIGYRGRKVGGAQVSEKHVNFIINDGGASSADFLTLVHQIQKAVREKYQIDLIMEVEKFNWQ